MMFPFGQSVLRDRQHRISDPYNPDSSTPGGWDEVDTVEIEGGFVGSSSSAAVASATRTQVISDKSLFCDPSHDVREGDRIRSGSRAYIVDAVPEADVNPFTGWQPVQEIPLKEVLG
jgi:hypothetical protein